jgi:hypothetical protein
MASSKKQKTCFIVRRYFVKSNKSVCCIVRNEKGIEYTTCLHANGSTSCTCKAGENGQKCYHVKTVQAKEQECTGAAPVDRATQAREICQSLGMIPAAQMKRVEKATLARGMQVVECKPDKMMDAPLNGNAGFSLLRQGR